ncbi:MAG: hypothetical protein HY586_01610 [Candidatus Omnitrophica bacterium]|nr:hypothetical protein [Candidatus Omnitrophota bacterium]
MIGSLMGLNFIPIANISDVTSLEISEMSSPLAKRRDLNQKTGESPNVYEVEMKPKSVRTIQTAPDYFTIINLPEPALNVYVGNQSLFKVEVYERQVLIKPITGAELAQTNLHIETRSGRFTFQVTVGPPETAEYIVDAVLGEELIEGQAEAIVKEKETQLLDQYQKKELEFEKRVEEKADQKLMEQLMEENESRNLKSSRSKGNVQINLLSLSRIAERIYLKFSILNFSNTSYKVLKIVLASQKQKGWFHKDREDFRELQTQSNAPSEIKPGEYVYGVLSTAATEFDQGQGPVFLIFEESGSRNIEISGFPWLKHSVEERK